MMKNIWIAALIAGLVLFILAGRQSILLWIGGFLVGLAAGIWIERKGVEKEREE